MTRDEILEMAKENCQNENEECAIYKNGFLNGYLKCLKDTGKYKNFIWKIKNLPKAIYTTYLCIKFPFLKSRGYNDKPLYPFLQWGSWWGCIPKGWRKAFGLQLCKELKAELKRCNYLKKYRISDVKEKFGSLQVYDGGAPEGSDIQDILHKYEFISYRTCIECGRPAKYITSGWICPYCEDCIDEYKKANAEKFYSDIPWYGWTNADYYEKHKNNRDTEIEE